MLVSLRLMTYGPQRKWNLLFFCFFDVETNLVFISSGSHLFNFLIAPRSPVKEKRVITGTRSIKLHESQQKTQKQQSLVRHTSAWSHNILRGIKYTRLHDRVASLCLAGQLPRAASLSNHNVIPRQDSLNFFLFFPPLT